MGTTGLKDVWQKEERRRWSQRTDGDGGVWCTLWTNWLWC